MGFLDFNITIGEIVFKDFNKIIIFEEILNIKNFSNDIQKNRKNFDRIIKTNIDKLIEIFLNNMKGEMLKTDYKFIINKINQKVDYLELLLCHLTYIMHKLTQEHIACSHNMNNGDLEKKLNVNVNTYRFFLNEKIVTIQKIINYIFKNKKISHEWYKVIKKYNINHKIFKNSNYVTYKIICFLDEVIIKENINQYLEIKNSDLDDNYEIEYKINSEKYFVFNLIIKHKNIKIIKQSDVFLIANLYYEKGTNVQDIIKENYTEPVNKIYDSKFGFNFKTYCEQTKNWILHNLVLNKRNDLMIKFDFENLISDTMPTVLTENIISFSQNLKLIIEDSNELKDYIVNDKFYFFTSLMCRVYNNIDLWIYNLNDQDKNVVTASHGSSFEIAINNKLNNLSKNKFSIIETFFNLIVDKQKTKNNDILETDALIFDKHSKTIYIVEYKYVLRQGDNNQWINDFIVFSRHNGYIEKLLKRIKYFSKNIDYFSKKYNIFIKKVGGIFVTSKPINKIPSSFIFEDYCVKMMVPETFFSFFQGNLPSEAYE